MNAPLVQEAVGIYQISYVNVHYGIYYIVCRIYELDCPFCDFELSNSSFIVSVSHKNSRGSTSASIVRTDYFLIRSSHYFLIKSECED